MMEFALGFFLGMLALPWYWLGILTLLFIVDVVLVENECFGWTATSLLVVGGLAAWLGGDVNPFTWVFYNAQSIATFFLLYFLAGALWSVFKWYFYLLKVRDKVRSGEYGYGYAAGDPRQKGESGKLVRPERSYAKNNKGRIMGWIGYWPFSVLGTLVGDFLTRIVTSIYRVLSGLYEAMANKVFADFD